MTSCPKCSRQNADDALYCDQCRTAVHESVHGEALAEPCPACGGKVKEVPSTAAMCVDCGIFMGEVGASQGGCSHHEPAAKAAEPKAAHAAEPEAEPEPPAARVPCPVCGFENAESDPVCGDCAIAFRRSRAPVTCPRCEAVTAEETCACGAILTLPRLLSFVDGSAKVVCVVCKQLFTVARDSCSDCGGEMLSADALRALVKR